MLYTLDIRYGRESPPPDPTGKKSVIVIDNPKINVADAIASHLQKISVDHYTSLIIDGFEEVSIGKISSNLSFSMIRIRAKKIADDEKFDGLSEIGEIEIRCEENTHLSISNPYIYSVTIYCKSAKTIDFNGSDNISSISVFDSPNLQTVAVPPSVNEITINNCGLTDLNVIKSDIPLEDLYFLDVSHNRLSDEIDLSPFPNLEVLDAGYNQFTYIPESVSNKGLCRIHLPNNPIRDIKYPIKVNTDCESVIELSGCNLINPEFAIIGKDLKKVRLYISGPRLEGIRMESRIGEVCIEASPRFTDLSKIHAAGGFVRIENLPVEKVRLNESVRALSIENCPKLKSLADFKADIEFIGIAGLDLNGIDLPEIPTLKSMDILLKLPSIRAVSPQPNVTDLKIFSVESLDGIERFPKLKRLRITMPVEYDGESVKGIDIAVFSTGKYSFEVINSVNRRV